MTSSGDSNLSAVLETAKTPLKIQSRPIPKPKEGQVVIRNYAVAANPVDWKIQAYDFMVQKYPVILGSDVSGEIIEVGAKVTKFKVGDRVAAFSGLPVIDDIDTGAWQTYSAAPELAVTKIPERVSYAEGSTIPMAWATVVDGFFRGLKLPRPSSVQPPSTPQQKSGFLIWGASSSVGTAAVQLAKILGYEVFATASPRHHEYIKSLGASQVFDYRDAGVVDKIVAAAEESGHPLSLGFDTIGEGDTFELASSVVAKSSGGSGKLGITLPWPEDKPVPEGVAIESTMAFSIFTKDTALGQWTFNEFLQEALEKGTIVPAPRVDVVPGGIESAQKALDKLKAGVSAVKVVVEPK